MLLETIGAELKIASVDGLIRSYSPKEYLSLDMSQKVILTVTFPKLAPDQFQFRSYKIMPRAQNAHAMVNAAFLFEFDTKDDKKSVKSCQICYGGINSKFIHAEATENLLTGIDDLYTEENLEKAIKSLQSEIEPDSMLPDPDPIYRKHLAISLFYRFFLSTAPANKIKSEYASGSTGLERPLSSGIQTYQPDEKKYPLTEAIPKYEGLIQCSGEAEYVNDIFSGLTVDKELWAAFVPATEVHSQIVEIDPSDALVVLNNVPFLLEQRSVCRNIHFRFRKYQEWSQFSPHTIVIEINQINDEMWSNFENRISIFDIVPGENSFMPVNAGVIGITENEAIFIELNSEVQYNGQPCGMIVAKTMAIAYSAANKVKITYEKPQVDRPIIPSLKHWRKKYALSACDNSMDYRFAANCKLATPIIGEQKKIKGFSID